VVIEIAEKNLITLVTPISQKGKNLITLKLRRMKIEYHNLYTHFILIAKNRMPLIPEKNRERIEIYHWSS